MDDDDPLLMSLADALTCAFGAALALFMIFVVLVRFAPPSPVVTSGVQQASSLSRSVAAEEPGASSLVFQAHSRHDTYGFDCNRSSVFSMEIANVGTPRKWTAQEPVFTKNGYATKCIVAIEAPDGVQPGKAPAILISRGHRETIHLQFRVGALTWPGSTAARFDIPSVLPGGSCTLVQVTGRASEPVLVEGC